MVSVPAPSQSRETQTPYLSVIVPAYRAEQTLPQCVHAIHESDFPDEARELIVINDGGSVNDGGPDGPRGPAHARNVGAQRARGHVLVFVDADVVVSPRALSQFAALFRNDPGLVAAFGAYDTRPSAPGFVSQYRNLLHHYVHTQHPGPARTFWSGCGAVRRAEFLASGGFHSARFPKPLCEDIEFGYRLTDAGHRVRLVPQIQGTHLKQWTLGSMVRTDLFARAIPWMHLLIERRAVSREGALNLAVGERLLTATAGVLCLSLVLALVLADARWLLLSAVCIVMIVLGNAKLLAWFARERGWWFAVRVVPLRVLFHVVSGVGALVALLTHHRMPAWSAPSPLSERPEHATA